MLLFLFRKKFQSNPRATGGTDSIITVFHTTPWGTKSEKSLINFSRPNRKLSNLGGLGKNVSKRETRNEWSHKSGHGTRVLHGNLAWIQTCEFLLKKLRWKWEKERSFKDPFTLFREWKKKVHATMLLSLGFHEKMKREAGVSLNRWVPPMRCDKLDTCSYTVQRTPQGSCCTHLFLGLMGNNGEQRSEPSKRRV